ncbi:flavin reductase family protein [Shewanella sp. MMG014]|uniref:flavin reductase family protein n=1 Tax=Shewanella sp. MMG014 TaxID=2822691 RepID=UPI001B360D3B|nr:flavin reductase family protein [Shewanella sp. MMG014]MBQ4889673.1 flavin reductase family protein [Shewanella sp. MMG014]
MEFLPHTLTAQQMYKLLIGGITPRPIAWVSTVSAKGVPNLAPFSFFTVASANPPVLCFNPMSTDKGVEKDTLVNIREQQEFVINTVSHQDLSVMNQTCHSLPPEQNEFEYAGIETLDSTIVKPSRVKQAVVSFECRLNQIVDLGNQPLAGHLILGDVVAVHVKDDAIDNFKIDADQLDAIGRMAGSDYCLTRDKVQLMRE